MCVPDDRQWQSQHWIGQVVPKCTLADEIMLIIDQAHPPWVRTRGDKIFLQALKLQADMLGRPLPLDLHSVNIWA